MLKRKNTMGFGGIILTAMVRTRSQWCQILALCCCMRIASPAQSSHESAAQTFAAQGQRALAAEQYAEAQTNFERLAALEPGIAEVHATLAAIYFKQREYDLAVREVRTAQRLKPSLPKLDSLLGVSLAELGQFKEALPGLEKGFKQDADHEIARMCGLQLLRAYTGLKRDSDAVATALAMNKRFPRDPEILYQTSRIYGNFAFLTMIELKNSAPGSVWVLEAEGEAHESQRAYEQAISEFKRVLQLDPQRPGIHYRLGRILLDRWHETQAAEDLPAAKQEFGLELATDPANANAAYEIGEIDRKAGDLGEARTMFETALRNHPDFPEAQSGIGDVLASLSKPSEALPHLEQAVALRPDDQVGWYRLSQVYRTLKDPVGQKRALAEFQRLRAQTGEDHPARPSEVTQQGIDSPAGPPDLEKH